MMSNLLKISEPTNGDSEIPEKPLRRSSRQPATTAAVKTREVSAETASTSSLNEPRRNPKRKAAEAARESINLPDNLLDEALRPLTSADIEEWEGWIELESEPVSVTFDVLLITIKVKYIKLVWLPYIMFYKVLIYSRHFSTLFCKTWESEMSKCKSFSALIKAG